MKKAKEDWVNMNCNEIDNCYTPNDTKNAYQIINKSLSLIDYFYNYIIFLYSKVYIYIYYFIILFLLINILYVI